MTDRDIVDSQQGRDPNLVTPTITSVGDVPKMDMNPILPRQTRSGYSRGIETISGSLIVADPTTNNPVMTISGSDQNQTFADPNTKVNQIVIGNLGDGTYGMKVSPFGIDVLKADDEELIFNSGQNIFKIAKVLQVPYVISATDVSNFYAIPIFYHNLGYIPTVIAVLTNDGFGSSRPIPFLYSQPASYFGTIWPSYAVTIQSIDSMRIVCKIDVTGAAGMSFLLSNTQLTFKFYCLQESAT